MLETWIARRSPSSAAWPMTLRAPARLVRSIRSAAPGPTATTAAQCTTASHPASARRTASASVMSPVTASEVSTPSAPAARASFSGVRTRKRTA